MLPRSAAETATSILFALFFAYDKPAPKLVMGRRVGSSPGLPVAFDSGVCLLLPLFAVGLARFTEAHPRRVDTRSLLHKNCDVLGLRNQLALRRQPESVCFHLVNHVVFIQADVLHRAAARHRIRTLVIIHDHKSPVR